jgi:hypothetical protein
MEVKKGERKEGGERLKESDCMGFSNLNHTPVDMIAKILQYNLLGQGP